MATSPRLPWPYFPHKRETAPGLLVRVAVFAPGQAPGSDAERVGFVDFTEHEGRRCIAEHATMAMQNGYTLVTRRATEAEARAYATDGPMRAGARAGRVDSAEQGRRARAQEEAVLNCRHCGEAFASVEDLQGHHDRTHDREEG